MEENNAVSGDEFWHIRAAKYDKLFWTKDKSYLDDIILHSDLNKEHIVLDVGTGTGTIAKKVAEHVRHVVAVDSSNSMLEQGDWTGVSVVKWDIGAALFKDSIYHRVIARMVFHHILDNIDRAFLRCYDLLKNGGKICIAEGVPPLDDPDVVQWYTDMFKLKEERRTFIPSQLVHFLEKNGFANVTCHYHSMEKFSIGNWLKNSGLDEERQQEIFSIHQNAPEKIKKAYNMQITSDDCLVRTKNVIVVGKKQ